jgi:NitT/TauT family transport system substrate-binding protein
MRGLNYMKLRIRSVVGILGVLSLGATLAACSSGGSSSSTSSSVSSSAAASASSSAASQGSALTTVTVGNFPTSALTLPFAIAQDRGYFKDAGLNVQTVSATSGPVLASELIGGTTQIAVEVPPNAFPAMQQGEPMVALPPYGRLDLALVTPNGSGVTSLKSLAGKRIGVTQRGAFTEKFADYVLQAAGVSPASVTFIAVGALATQEAALSNHQIDATVLSSDAIAAFTAHGFTLTTLASSLNGTAGQLGAVGLQSFWATTTGFRTSHPQVVKDFCTAMSRATAFLANNANRSAGLPTIEKLLSVPAPVAGQVWDTVHSAWVTQITATRWGANAKLILGSATALPFGQDVAASC